MSDYRGLLFVGDPHLSSKAPGGRKDDYRNAILDKLRWCLDYARGERLLFCLLGDLFHQTRERDLSLLGDIATLFRGREVLSIYGNHDIQADDLTDDQAFAVLVHAGLIRLVSETDPWRGTIAGQSVVVAGTSFGQPIPLNLRLPGWTAETLTFWMLHHEVTIGDTAGHIDPAPLDGVEVVVNGHLHKRYDSVRHRHTEWFNPGNIARCTRGARPDPGVLRFDLRGGKRYDATFVPVPHRTYDEVFFEKTMPGELVDAEDAEGRVRSEFVQKLKLLGTHAGVRGENLQGLLRVSEDRFEPEVFAKLEELAERVVQNE